MNKLYKILCALVVPLYLEVKLDASNEILLLDSHVHFVFICPSYHFLVGKKTNQAPTLDWTRDLALQSLVTGEEAIWSKNHWLDLTINPSPSTGVFAFVH